MKWIILVLISGCAQITSLNLKKHQFGVLPTKIVWFQVAGLEEEHMALIRFDQSADKKTSFEQSLCVGKTWNYNLYHLRNSASHGFLSQMTGKKNIKSTCEDTQLRPIWNYIRTTGYQTVVLENGVSDQQTLNQFKKCGEQGNEFLSNTFLFVRSSHASDEAQYTARENIPFTTPGTRFNRTCLKTECQSSLEEDFLGIYQNLNKNFNKHLYIIRDFSYLNAINKNDFLKARDILNELERIYSLAIKLTEKQDYLVLLTTSESQFIAMPEEGKEWRPLDIKSQVPYRKNRNLTNLVLATGSRAENFCGLYDDSQILDRILSGPKQQGLELQIINPFK
jgi:hypothetical protein